MRVLLETSPITFAVCWLKDMMKNAQLGVGCHNSLYVPGSCGMHLIANEEVVVHIC